MFLGKDIKNAKKTYTEEGNSNQKSAIRSEIREERIVLHMTSKTLRFHWQNCYGPDDNSFLSDDDLKAIDEKIRTLGPWASAKLPSFLNRKKRPKPQTQDDQ